MSLPVQELATVALKMYRHTCFYFQVQGYALDLLLGYPQIHSIFMSPPVTKTKIYLCLQHCPKDQPWESWDKLLTFFIARSWHPSPIVVSLVTEQLHKLHSLSMPYIFKCCRQISASSAPRVWRRHPCNCPEMSFWRCGLPLEARKVWRPNIQAWMYSIYKSKKCKTTHVGMHF